MLVNHYWLVDNVLLASVLSSSQRLLLAPLVAVLLVEVVIVALSDLKRTRCTDVATLVQVRQSGQSGQSRLRFRFLHDMVIGYNDPPQVVLAFRRLALLLMDDSFDRFMKLLVFLVR